MASLLEQAMSAFRSGNSAEGARLLALSSSTSPGSTGKAAIVHDTIEPTVTPVPISTSASKPPPPKPQVTPIPVIVFSEEERDLANEIYGDPNISGGKVPTILVDSPDQAVEQVSNNVTSSEETQQGNNIVTTETSTPIYRVTSRETGAVVVDNIRGLPTITKKTRALEVPGITTGPGTNIGPTETMPINPNVSEVVTQQTPKVSYQQPLSTGQMTGNEPTPDTGTFATPVQTAGLSAVPSAVTYKTHYAGTSGNVPTTLTVTDPGTGQSYAYTGGYRTVYYVNALGQRIPVTEFNGSPTTYVPPGFAREQRVAFNEGGLMNFSSNNLFSNMINKIREENDQRIADKLGTDTAGVEKLKQASATPAEGENITSDPIRPFGDLPNVIMSSEGGGPADPSDYTVSRYQNADGSVGKGYTITWSDGTSAYTSVRNPASGANDARVLADIFAKRQQAAQEAAAAQEEEEEVAPTPTPPRPTPTPPRPSPPPPVDTTTTGGEFTPTEPETEVLELGAGEVAPIDPNRPQTVKQDVGPITYGTGTDTSTPVIEEGVDTGTTPAPLQTAGLSAVPDQITYKTHYAGTQGAVPQTLVTTVPGMGTTYDASKAGYQNVTYGNALGQRITISELNGQPTTYVPPGFMRLKDLESQQQALTSQVAQPQSESNLNPFGVPEGAVGSPELTNVYKGGMMRKGYAEGGSVPEDGPDVQLARRFLGFQGPSEQLTNFLAANPAAAARMGKYQQAMAGMARNRVGAQTGIVGTSLEDFQQMQQNLTSQTMQPIQSAVAGIQPTAADFIPVDAGMTVPMAPFSEVATTGTVQQAEMPTEADASTYTAATSFGDVSGVTSGMQPAQGTVSDQAQVTAAQQGTSAVSDLKAEQGTAIMMDNPVQRKIETDPVTGESELISGVANAQTAAAFNEQIQAATATPTKQATVQGQLETLMAQFEGGNTPAWAAGSMRTAMQTLAARGLGASSLAGQAVIQAAMEAALPIAQIDAQTQAQFESQNLSNRQQRAMLAAQQRAQFLGQEFDQAFQARVQNSARIGDIANMNFTAEQNIALENSRAANTMNLQNLSNSQAMVMAEAAALANLDMANLNNRQQAAVQNAQNFLQMDMANLNNEQQTAMFKAQQNIQALFTDQAAENAAAQFNASSENQTNQFFANLASQTSQFNATQQNAMDQFNVNSTNAMRQFNSELQQQRDLFNAQNGLVIAQANAQWRQNIATLNQAAQNESNMNFAKTINALTSTNLDNIWQRERDIMSFAFTADQSAMDRALSLIMADKELQAAREKLSAMEDAADTNLAMRFLFGSSPEGILSGIF